jgi:hypothetical protein
MALPRLFPGSITTPALDERSSEGAGVNRRTRRPREKGAKTIVFNRGLFGSVTIRVAHTKKSAWIAGRGFGRLRVIMEDAFYGWIVWD